MANPLRSDPTKLTTVRRALRAESKRRVRSLVRAAISTDPDRFEREFERHASEILLADWWSRWLSESYRRGARRTFREARKAMLSTDGPAAEQEFLRQLADSTVIGFQLNAEPFAKALSSTVVQVDRPAGGNRWEVERDGVIIETVRADEFRDEVGPGSKHVYRRRTVGGEWSRPVEVTTPGDIIAPIAFLGVLGLVDRFRRAMQGVLRQTVNDATDAIEEVLRAERQPDMIVPPVTAGVPTVRRRISRELPEVVRRAESRIARIVETEVTRAHAHGQIDGLDRLGVTEVLVEAEVQWRTRNDGRVCPMCRPLEGKMFKVAEARGLIPRHPNCRCAFRLLPVPDARTARQRRSTQAAVRRSALAEVPRVGRGGRTRKVRTRLGRSRWPGTRKVIR